MITAEVVAHSIAHHHPSSKDDGENSEIVTFLLTYPRWIHSEFMTHRVFSRNAASSRAIPFRKMAAAVWKQPAIPECWRANQKGMQAGEDLPPFRARLAKWLWKAARIPALAAAWTLYKLGLHKQWANRILEPWMHITVLATATDLGNFFMLRAHKDAQPEFQVLAFRMLKAYLMSKPRPINPGEWHLPLVSEVDRGRYTLGELKILSVARAARTSYTALGDGTPGGELEGSAKLYRTLSGSGHWSPFEHVAQALEKAARVGNFKGFIPLRKQHLNECHQPSKKELEGLLWRKPTWVEEQDFQQYSRHLAQ